MLKRKTVPAVMVAAMLLGGCTTAPAAMELITVARKGLAQAKSAEQQRYADDRGDMAAQRAAMARAFDADVRRVAAGTVRDADGNAVGLTPEWVISAQRGYTAATELLLEEALAAQHSHAVRMDNLTAADEALEMAGQLMLRQAAMTEKLRGAWTRMQRRLIDGE